MAYIPSYAREPDCHNLCLIGRRRAHMTQAEWAEAIGVSLRSVVDYEAMKALPQEATVVRMAEKANLPILCYWYLRQAVGYSTDMLPEAEQVSLPQAVIILLKAMRDLQKRDVTGQLLDMAEDGVIDVNEEPVYLAICDELKDLIQAAVLLLAADTEGDAG